MKKLLSDWLDFIVRLAIAWIIFLIIFFFTSLFPTPFELDRTTYSILLLVIILLANDMKRESK